MSYYISFEGNILGPLSAEEIREEFNNGDLKQDTLFSKDKKTWIKLEDATILMESDHEKKAKANMPLERRLLPIPNIKSSRQRMTVFCVMFAILPMLASWTLENEGVNINELSQESVILLSAAGYFLVALNFTFLWSVLLGVWIRPHDRLLRNSIFYALYTGFIGVFLLLAIQGLPVIKDFYEAFKQGTEDGNLLMLLIGGVFGIGLCEEICKALPVLFFAVKCPFTKKDFMTMMIASGFGFALSESIIYSFRYAESMQRTMSQPELDAVISLFFYVIVLTTQVTRFISLPIFHASLSGILGSFIDVGSHAPVKKFLKGLLLVAVIHGVYNAACVFAPMNILVLGFTIALLFYRFKVVEIEDFKIINSLENLSESGGKNNGSELA